MGRALKRTPGTVRQTHSRVCSLGCSFSSVEVKTTQLMVLVTKNRYVGVCVCVCCLFLRVVWPEENRENIER